jgi:hypothetical protein
VGRHDHGRGRQQEEGCDGEEPGAGGHWFLASE